MAKRRTKKQKQRSRNKRVFSKTEKVVVSKKERLMEFGYEQSLIRGDLRKTVFISVLIIGIEIGLFFLLSS